MKLTAKQESFAWHYAMGASGAEAYRRAYDCREGISHASVEATKLLANPNVALLVDQIKADILQRRKDAADALVNQCLAVLAYQPAEITKIVRVPCRYCHGHGHAYQWRETEYMEKLKAAEAGGKPLPDIAGGFGYDTRLQPVDDCPNCNGRGLEMDVITPTDELSPQALAGFLGVKRTRNGLEILLADKDKAMERLARLLGLDKTTLNLTDNTAALAAKLAAGVDPNDAARAYAEMMNGGG